MHQKQKVQHTDFSAFCHKIAQNYANGLYSGIDLAVYWTLSECGKACRVGSSQGRSTISQQFGLPKMSWILVKNLADLNGLLAKSCYEIIKVVSVKTIFTGTAYASGRPTGEKPR